MKTKPIDITAIEKEGLKIKYELFEKMCSVREGHPGSILSIFDIVNALYLSGSISVEKNRNINDVFIMSKGHAAAVQYPYLVKKGIISREDWDNWGDGETNLRVFANKNIPGIDVTSGSLGHGLGIAAGIALANRLDAITRKIFVVISEGELYEGSTWEALLFISHHKLSEIKIILDVNRNMILGRPEDLLQIEPINQKFESFGFTAMRINGHDYTEIFSGIDYLAEENDGPRVLIADTIKGKGVSFMEDTSQSHYWGGMSETKMRQMLSELAS